MLLLLFGSLLFVTVCEALAGECPSGWWSTDEGEFCYHVSESRLTFGQSLEYCWAAGGHLAEFRTKEEEEAVEAKLNEDIFFWIGLTDLTAEGVWRWTESHQEPSYINWAPGQPDNEFDNEDCACIFGGWHDVACDVDYYGRPLHALCQKRFIEESTTTDVMTTSTASATTTATLTTTTNSNYIYQA